MAGDSRVVRAGPYPGREGAGLALLLEEGQAPRVVRIDWLPPLSTEALTRMSRDVARAGEFLHHPHIQAPLALECVDGAFGLVLEWVDGASLGELLEVGGRLPPAIAARVIRDACEALHFAHEEDPEEGPFVHGWLLPENLLVSRSGVTLVTGFGGGTARAVGELLPWQSPEQVLGGQRAASRQSDIYGLGLLLHACLAGENPFAREPDLEVAILSRPPPSLEPLGVPPALAAVARRAMSVKAADRFASAGEMGRALEDAAREVASPAEVAGWVESLFPTGMGVRAARQRALDSAMEAARLYAPARRSEAEEVAEEQIVPEPGSERSGQGEPGEDVHTDRFQFVAPPFPPPLSSVVGPADILGEAPPVPPPVGPRREARSAQAAPRSRAAEPAAAAPGPAAAPSPRRGGAFGAAAALAAVGGLAIGWWLSAPRTGTDRSAPGETASVATAPPLAEPSPPPAPPPQAGRGEPTVARATGPAPASRPTLEVTASEPGDVLVDGKRVGLPPLSRSVRSGRHEVRLVNRNLGLDVVRSVEVQGARTSLAIDVGKGRLTVTAPEGAEISLDGRPVGTGRVRDLEIWEGRHHLAVRLGPARHEHAFQVAAKESYEYEVTAAQP